MKMMIAENENGLKGQHNLAQGKRSGALGLENRYENRPRQNVILAFQAGRNAG
jgi:hypothetical protein